MAVAAVTSICKQLKRKHLKIEIDINGTGLKTNYNLDKQRTCNSLEDNYKISVHVITYI